MTTRMLCIANSREFAPIRPLFVFHSPGINRSVTPHQAPVSVKEDILFECAGVRAEGHIEAWCSQHQGSVGEGDNLGSFHCWTLGARCGGDAPQNKLVSKFIG